jgi:hypothetical protein
MRKEREVFADLSALCRSAGYIHALAFLCFRDNMVRYSGEMRPVDMRNVFSNQRLIRTETSTLTGLMVQGQVSYVEGALSRLEALCGWNKYKQRAPKWFGICILPADKSLRFGLSLDYAWEPDAVLDAMLAGMEPTRAAAAPVAPGGSSAKVGMNDPCPCESGLEYRKCCLGK